ncbi:MAG: ArsR/SmtB family transcription factor [Vicinamibacterales bacterium]
MESTFGALAEPSRLAIVGLLRTGERTVQELEAVLGLPQPTISKHLRVLRTGGLVDCRVQAQWRVYRLRPERFVEIERWLTPYRELWRQSLSALEEHLDRQAATPPRPRKER